MNIYGVLAEQSKSAGSTGGNVLVFNNSSDDWKLEDKAINAVNGSIANIAYYDKSGGAYSLDSKLIPTEKDTVVIACDRVHNNISKSANARTVTRHGNSIVTFADNAYMRLIGENILILRYNHYLKWSIPTDIDMILDFNMCISNLSWENIWGIGDSTKMGTSSLHGAGIFIRRNNSSSSITIYNHNKQSKNSSGMIDMLGKGGKYQWFRISLANISSNQYDIRIYQEGKLVLKWENQYINPTWVMGLGGVRESYSGWRMFANIRFTEGAGIAPTSDTDISGDVIFKPSWTQENGSSWGVETTVDKAEQWIKDGNGEWIKAWSKN